MINQCPECGSKCFSKYTDEGWMISCSWCEYDSDPHETEVGAENNYRHDYNKAFEQGFTVLKEVPKQRSRVYVTDDI